MATNRVYTESVVTLNNQEATARIDELKKKAVELRQEMTRLAQEKGINSKEFKAAQKELIAIEKSQRALNEDTKKYERILNDLNGSNLNDLQYAYRKLQQQIRRLKPDTEEFIAASQKMKEVRARMKEINDQTKITQKTFGGFFSKIGWTAIVTGAIAMVKKLASDMIAQTQLVGDKWRSETAGWKDAYGVFIADLASGRGWNEMISRMKAAYKSGKEIQNILDELFERNNSLAVQESETNLEVEKQRKIMMDVTKSIKERLDAAKEIDRLETELADRRKDVAQQEVDAYKDRLQKRTELTDAELEAFILSYNNNRELIKEGQAYYDKIQELETSIHNTKRGLMTDTNQMARQLDTERLQALQDELAQFKASADESVAYWAETIGKYNLGNDEMVKNYVDAYRKKIDADTQYERATSRSNKQAASLRKQLSQDAQNAANEAYKKDIEASNARYQELQNQAKKAYADGEISYQEYEQRLNDIQRKSLEDRLAIAERHKQSTVEIQSQILDLAVKDKQKLDKLMEDMEKDAQKAMDDLMAELDKEVEEYFAEIDKQREEDLEKWQEMCERAEEIRKGLSPVAAIKAEMQEELDALNETHNNGLLAEEEYQRARAQIAAKYAAKIGSVYTQHLDKMAELSSALQEAESARLNAQMQEELTAAGDNAEKREEIEAKYEQKQLDLKKQYADVDMGINIAKTVANGAVAAIKAFADLGPIAGGVMAAIIAATTIAEVATIVAQRNAIKNSSVSSSGSSKPSIGQRKATGYSGGGYTEKASNDYQEVGIVHANEWVAPAAMVRANPVMFASLEQMRQSGNYHSSVPGFADGGTVPGSTSSATQPQGNIDNELLRMVYELFNKLLASLPLKAYLLLSEVNKQQELEATIKSIVGKE